MCPTRFAPSYWLAVLCAILFTACQGGAASLEPLPVSQRGVFTAQEALSELSQLEPQAGIDVEVFTSLKASLAAMLRGQPDRRFTQAAPCGAAGKVVDLIVYNNGDGSATCSWTYCNYGDYDLNSQVTINDITPVGQHFKRKATHHQWPLAKVADGDLNGEVNIADITPVGQYLGSAVAGYRLQANTEYPASENWIVVGEIPFAQSQVCAIGGPRRFNQIVPGAEVGVYFRVVPLHDSTAGEASDPVQYSGAPAPEYCISGNCAGLSGEGLNGVTVKLEGQSELISDGAGAYCFTGFRPGYVGQISAELDAMTILPASRIVIVHSADVTGVDFAAFPADRIEHNLPQQTVAGQSLALDLTVVDASGAALAGFDTEAELLIAPLATVVTKPALAAGTQELAPKTTASTARVPLQFTDGVAQAEVVFAEAGAYSVAVEGLGAVLDQELGQTTVAQPVTPELSIAVWRHDSTAAVSLSFDDGTAEHWSRGLPLWEEYGFRVTLGILASRFLAEPARLPQLQQAFDAGHELANHTSTHQDLTTLTAAEVSAELQGCQDLLLENVDGLDYVLTAVYPYTEYNDSVVAILQDMGIYFARSGEQDTVEVTPLNDAWDPPCYHLYSWANLNVLPDWMWDDAVDSAVTTGNWLIEQCHGIGSEGETGVGWSPQPESAFRAHYDHIQSYGDKLWVAPVSEVGRYILERNQAQFEVLSCTGGELSFVLYDAWDDAIFDIPLTVRMQQLPDWTAINVLQGQVALPVELRDGWFVFDVAPGGGIVRVKRQS